MCINGKGSWTVFSLGSVTPTEIRDRISTLSTTDMFNLSALKAKAYVHARKASKAMGILPVGSPRLDEPVPFAIGKTPCLYAAFEQLADSISDGNVNFDEASQVTAYLEQFCAHPELLYLDEAKNYVGFWLAVFEKVDIEDKQSLLEDSTAVNYGRTYNSLPAVDRKVINKSIRGFLPKTCCRVQVPVIIDLTTNKLYLGTAKNSIIEGFGIWAKTATMLNGVALRPFKLESLPHVTTCTDFILKHDSFSEERRDILSNAGEGDQEAYLTEKYPNLVQDAEFVLSCLSATSDLEELKSTVPGTDVHATVGIFGPYTMVLGENSDGVRAASNNDAVSLIDKCEASVDACGLLISFSPIEQMRVMLDYGLYSMTKFGTFTMRYLDASMLTVDTSDVRPSTTMGEYWIKHALQLEAATTHLRSFFSGIFEATANDQDESTDEDESL